MRGFYHFKTRPLHAKRVVVGQKRWQLWLPVGLLLLGVCVGAVAEEMSRTNGQAYTTFFVRQVLSIYCDSTFTGVMGFLFLSSFLLHTIILFFSFSCIGAPAVLLIPFVKGFSFGCISGYLYGTLGLRGVLANMLLCLLPQLGEAALLLYFSMQALQMSTSLFRYLIAQKADSCIRTHGCLQAYLTTSLLLIATSTTGALLAKLFAPVFLTG